MKRRELIKMLRGGCARPVPLNSAMCLRCSAHRLLMPSSASSPVAASTPGDAPPFERRTPFRYQGYSVQNCKRVGDWNPRWGFLRVWRATLADEPAGTRRDTDVMLIPKQRRVERQQLAIRRPNELACSRGSTGRWKLISGANGPNLFEVGTLI